MPHQSTAMYNIEEKQRKRRLTSTFCRTTMPLRKHLIKKRVDTNTAHLKMHISVLGTGLVDPFSRTSAFAPSSFFGWCADETWQINQQHGRSKPDSVDCGRGGGVIGRVNHWPVTAFPASGRWRSRHCRRLPSGSKSHKRQMRGKRVSTTQCWKWWCAQQFSVLTTIYEFLIQCQMWQPESAFCSFFILHQR